MAFVNLIHHAYHHHHHVRWNSKHVSFGSTDFGKFSSSGSISSFVFVCKPGRMSFFRVNLPLDRAHYHAVAGHWGAAQWNKSARWDSIIYQCPTARSGWRYLQCQLLFSDCVSQLGGSEHSECHFVKPGIHNSWKNKGYYTRQCRDAPLQVISFSLHVIRPLLDPRLFRGFWGSPSYLDHM